MPPASNGVEMFGSRLLLRHRGENLAVTPVIMVLAWVALSVVAGLLTGLFMKAAHSVRTIPVWRSRGSSVARQYQRTTARV